MPYLTPRGGGNELVPASRKGHIGERATAGEAKTTNWSINNTSPGALHVPFLKAERGGARTARELWESGRVQECRRRGRMIWVRNNEGRAAEAAEASVRRTTAGKKARGWLPPPLMAEAGLRG